MHIIEAVVRNGRLTLDEPTDLPDGEVVELVPVDHDDLEEQERAMLRESLERAWAQEEAGQGRPSEHFLDEL